KPIFSSFLSRAPRASCASTLAVVSGKKAFTASRRELPPSPWSIPRLPTTARVTAASTRRSTNRSAAPVTAIRWRGAHVVCARRRGAPGKCPPCRGDRVHIGDASTVLPAERGRIHFSGAPPTLVQARYQRGPAERTRKRAAKSRAARDEIVGSRRGGDRLVGIGMRVPGA